jgi:para-aminobenzoate synthetase component 1
MMIVDLERNDMNRVCEVGSVEVPELARLRSYPTVHHLVSTVRGRRKSSVSTGDLFRNLFPGGSVTGAPKSMAIRLIHHLEGRSRGLYTGTLGYWDRDRDRAEWNILIRTLIKHGKQAWWDAGGGIVIDSDPDREYRESVDKTGPLQQIRKNTVKTYEQR